MKKNILVISLFFILCSASDGQELFIKQVGNDVLVTGMGSINLSDYKKIGTGGYALSYLSTESFGDLSESGEFLDRYMISGPRSFGPSDPASFAFADAASETGFHLGVTLDTFGVPVGTIAFNLDKIKQAYRNRTLHSFGFTEGVYIFKSKISDSEIKIYIGIPNEVIIIPENKNIRIEFTGVIQSSDNLDNWYDMDPQPTSPFYLEKKSSAYFRSRIKEFR
jgi:hypothetical protein